MGYLVLARKWRPQSFDDLVGQESIIRVLQNAIKQSRIAHAYLFSGPRGVGKTSTARILSKALNCIEGPTASPCGKCDFCSSITGGSSVDVVEIDGASNNSVEDIRDLREKVKYAPSGGRYKVYIIDEAHMLSQSAFNALLKTLEEPPSHVVFVLATTVPNKVPVTVLSRCQHLPFKRIPTGTIRYRLDHIISHEERISITGSALELLSRSADGSMRDALTLLDQVAAFSEEITDDDLRDLLGISDLALLIDVSRAVLSGDRDSVIFLSGRIYESGLDIKDFARSLITLLRNLLLCKVLGDIDSSVDFNEEEKEKVREILSITSEEHLTALLEVLVRSENEIRMSSVPRIALEMSLIKASFLSRFRDIGDILGKLSSGEPGTVRDTGGKPFAKTGNVEAAEEMNETCKLSPATLDGKDMWSMIVKKINEKNHLLACKLEHTEVELNGDTLSLVFNGGFAVHADSVKSQRKQIEDAATEVAARNIKIDIKTKKKVEKQADDVKEDVLNDPLVKETLELFDGRIVNIQPRRAGEKS